MKQQAAHQSLEKQPLDERLKQVLAFIQWPNHADIGSDHAHLPLALLAAGRCQQVIVVELNEGPYQRSMQAAQRTQGRLQVRRGDGFGPLHPGEVDGASLCGMGAQTIIRVLERAQHLPQHLVLQPNADAGTVRRWAYTHGYHLRAEALAAGFWRYPVLALQRAQGPDHAYTAFGDTLQAALQYGPHLLQRRDPLLKQELDAQYARLQRICAAAPTGTRTDTLAQQRQLVIAALNLWDIDCEI